MPFHDNLTTIPPEVQRRTKMGPEFNGESSAKLPTDGKDKDTRTSVR